MYSKEFFNQRSFEVVWAVFRVAEYVSRPKLRQALEDRAIDYFSARNGASLDALEEFIRLAMNVGEIGKTNAGVLLREAGNLRAAMLELAETKSSAHTGSGADQNPQHLGPKDEPSIDGIFSRPPMLLGDFMEIIASTMGGGRASDDGLAKPPVHSSDLSPHSVSVYDDVIKPTVESGKSGRIATNSYIGKENESEEPANETGKEFGKDFDNPAIDKAAKTDTKPAIYAGNANHSKRNSAMPAEKRHAVIIEQLSHKTYSTLRDVAEKLPGVSERTLRYDVQRMVDKKIVERIGGGGPHSFLRLKRGKMGVL